MIQDEVYYEQAILHAYVRVVCVNRYIIPKDYVEPPRICLRLHFLRGWSNEQTQMLSLRNQERAVRLILEH